MKAQYTYLVILAASLAGPLLLSFDKKVAFYKNWRHWFYAVTLPALVYIAWDVYFTAKGVWAFNPVYVTGIYIINLPLEEVLFFFVVPYCCVFIYECIKAYFPQLKNKAAADVILMLLGLLLWITGIIFYRKDYTSWTFISNAVFIGIVYMFRNYLKTFDATVFLISYCIMLIPFLIVNGFLTSIPVVLYNNAENLGTRLYSIPVEDVFYGMLLILATIVIYEKLKSER
ncbi:lycopene cyclase domain-containing protein [Ferruginibacter sp.]